MIEVEDEVRIKVGLARGRIGIVVRVHYDEGAARWLDVCAEHAKDHYWIEEYNLDQVEKVE